MLLQEEDIHLLTQIGFTRAQAKLYLALVSLGKTEAKTLSKYADLRRQAVYRTLDELQQKGLVERIIALPHEYKAIPLQDGLEIMVSCKANEFALALEKTKKFLLKVGDKASKQDCESELSINLVNGKDTIIQKAKYAIDDLKLNVSVCTTQQRWIQVNLETVENVEDALARGVKFRVIIEKTGELTFRKEFKQILKHPNYEVRIVCDRLKVNAAIFDGAEASINFYPSKSLSESPMIWTNHPSLIVGLVDHFEKIWSQTQKLS